MTCSSLSRKVGREDQVRKAAYHVEVEVDIDGLHSTVESTSDILLAADGAAIRDLSSLALESLPSLLPLMRSRKTPSGSTLCSRPCHPKSAKLLPHFFHPRAQ